MSVTSGSFRREWEGMGTEERVEFLSVHAKHSELEDALRFAKDNRKWRECYSFFGRRRCNRVEGHTARHGDHSHSWRHEEGHPPVCGEFSPVVEGELDEVGNPKQLQCVSRRFSRESCSNPHVSACGRRWSGAGALNAIWEDAENG